MRCEISNREMANAAPDQQLNEDRCTRLQLQDSWLISLQRGAISPLRQCKSDAASLFSRGPSVAAGLTDVDGGYGVADGDRPSGAVGDTRTAVEPARDGTSSQRECQYDTRTVFGHCVTCLLRSRSLLSSDLLVQGSHGNFLQHERHDQPHGVPSTG